ncbi:T9SS type A sorting domain-containing protein [Algoriphagus boritolerans]|uniref:Por secretion system C-terminal sorting domain-containing protein n=1 Tax=Algoriphagus boritolerans DSM 17298 = JCM 18970 TaxID=1120964 RepID=A0A1H5XTC1_9BACT|nr:T9SS type A sorting domain-containing protein [Algoriphagus boritolerans]SEG14903.1 Por secretion system C-terminal sorting domain-containing protein [Algoriphagus boritolerans DSM 17298 = JCM 18970]
MDKHVLGLLDKEGREIAIGISVAGKMTFEVSHLQKGIYFIHVVVDGELTREQIIIE